MNGLLSYIKKWLWSFLGLIGLTIVLIGLLPAIATAEPLATGELYEPPVARLVLGLIICVFLAYASALVIKNIIRRRGGLSKPASFKFAMGNHDGNEVSVIETHRLNATHDVCLIGHDRKKYLVVLGPNTCKVLSAPEGHNEEHEIQNAVSEDAS